MATTHVFIVDITTFKLHLQYLFAGTGAKDKVVDFNNSPTTDLHYATENNLLGMIADFQRVRIGDYVIFYLQQNYYHQIYEGKFYGVFRVSSLPFLDNKDEGQFLAQELNKSLTFRIQIKPEQVYSEGVTEWEALDEIDQITTPSQMLWSLIYRKLKGNRGNTMITISESDRLVSLIRNKNNGRILNNNLGFSFNEVEQKIENTDTINNYEGRQESINILPRMIRKFKENRQFETHLQAYILQNIEQLPMFCEETLEWIGNEVSCGVGMQRIDIMLSIATPPNRKVIPIELKSKCIYRGITFQVQRYIDWIRQYYIPNCPSDIEPMIIARTIDKNSSEYHNFIEELRCFNIRNNLTLRYVEFTIDYNNETINFEEISY